VPEEEPVRSVDVLPPRVTKKAKNAATVAAAAAAAVAAGEVQEGEAERALKALQQNGARPFCKAPPGRTGAGQNKTPCPAGCGKELAPNQVGGMSPWPLGPAFQARCISGLHTGFCVFTCTVHVWQRARMWVGACMCVGAGEQGAGRLHVALLVHLWVLLVHHPAAACSHMTSCSTVVEEESLKCWSCCCLLVQGRCDGCDVDVKKFRAMLAASNDRGVWKQPNRSLGVLREKAQQVYNATNGQTHIGLVVYRQGLSKNKLVVLGEACRQPPLFVCSLCCNSSKLWEICSASYGGMHQSTRQLSHCGQTQARPYHQRSVVLCCTAYNTKSWSPCKVSRSRLLLTLLLSHGSGRA
jgi:hypothetical protein